MIRFRKFLTCLVIVCSNFFEQKFSEVNGDVDDSQSVL